MFSSSISPQPVGVETQTARQVFTEMKTTTLSYAKNFAVIGALFSGVECAIETVRLLGGVWSVCRDGFTLQMRGRSDWKNGTYAGAVTGGLIGLRGKEDEGVVGNTSGVLMSRKFYVCWCRGKWKILKACKCVLYSETSRSRAGI